MKKVFIFLWASLLIYNLPFAQTPGEDKKFSPAELKEDLAFIKQQIFAVHANPFTELTKEQYTKIFYAIEARLTDSLTTMEFFKLVRPTVSWLSDEHAGIGLPENAIPFNNRMVLPPFAIKKEKGVYVVDTVLAPNTGLAKGMIIKQVNHIDIGVLVNKCAEYASGFPPQRIDKAVQQFGYLYAMGNDNAGTYTVTLQNGKGITVPGVDGATWVGYLNGNSGILNAGAARVSYKKHGQTGYINTSSFSTKNDSDFDMLADTINGIFAQVQKDSIKCLIIDVSQNDGGNSAVGDVIIGNFYAKPYNAYQCNWRRSDEYLKVIRGWGVENKQYEEVKVGEILHYDSYTVTPGDNANRFKGKVYVVIGDGTFSSAIMFATIIKDNAIAPLVGQAPRDGHPTHFGELYSAKTPHTHITIRFGVKEWIRPAGKTGENVLAPDIQMNVATPLDVETMVKKLGM